MAVAANPQWTVPKDWQAGKASPVRRGSWAVNGPDGQQVEIAVTVFPGEVGGQLANVNRWRAQIGLEPITADKVDSMTTKLEWNGLTATVVDFNNPTPAPGAALPSRMIVATIPQGGNSWFFKMSGAAPLVEAQKPVFLDFVKSVKF
jgi:hypothetical protein